MTSCYRPLGAVEIRDATEADLPRLADLARRIWLAHYPPIIGLAQTEYMLAQRYSPQALRTTFVSGNPRFVLLFVDGDFVAFAGHGPSEDPTAWKLHQLYVLPEWQGRGLGGRLIRHVQSNAAIANRQTLILTVNRQNHAAIAAYRRAGFDVTQKAEFDIGNGFHMVDFIMSKPLPSHPSAPSPPSPSH